jgi:hypothetical protein
VAGPFLLYSLAMSNTAQLLERTVCYCVYFVTFIVCPVIAGYALTTLYFMLTNTTTY